MTSLRELNFDYINYDKEEILQNKEYWRKNMGTWGASVTASDTAQELMDEYSAAFSYYDVPTALEKLEQYVRTMFDESDEIEWCAYYYSLANYMWKKGILTDEIRDKALQMVESDYGMQDWIDAGKSAVKERRKELDKFVKRITTPQCEPKKIKVSLRPDDVFIDGEVIAIELKTDDRKFTPGSFTEVKLSDEEFLSYNKKYILIQKAYSEISCRSSVVPEVFQRRVCFRLFKGIYDSIENVDINALEVIPVSEDNRYVFLLDNSIAKFKKRNYKVIGTKELPEFNKRDQICFFDLSDNYPHTNFDSTMLRLLVDRELKICELCEEPEFPTVRSLIELLAYKELGYDFGLSNEDYKKLQEQRKALISNRIAEFEEMISMGARVFELRYGELLGVAIKVPENSTVLYMLSDDEKHRNMLEEYVNNCKD